MRSPRLSPLERARDAAIAAVPIVEACAAEPLPFRDFVRGAWSVIEPSTPYLHNWHVDAIIDFLECVTAGTIGNGIINIPPRCMKSTLVSVLWQPWVWTFAPGSRWIFGSYDAALSTRDTVKARRVIRSQWYRERWGSVFELEKDQNLKSRFENTRTGVRIATAVEGHGTGEGGTYIVADDPHKAKDAYSRAALDNAHTWWTGTMATRSDDPRNVKRLIIMQRLAVDDLTGRMLETGSYTHLCLPMVWESRIFDQLPKTSKRIPDPRTKEGELLWPERFDAIAVADLQVQLGPAGVASQLSQLPAPAGGSIVKRDWIKRWSAPANVTSPADIVRHLGLTEVQLHIDGRFKDDPLTGSYVVIAAWGKAATGGAYLVGMYRERVGYVDTRTALLAMCSAWPMARAKYVEAKASGTSIADDLKATIPGIVLYEPGNAGKIERLEAVAPYFAAGNVYVPDDAFAPWVPIAVSEITTFPRSSNDDIVDTTTQALSCLLDRANVLARWRQKAG